MASDAASIEKKPSLRCIRAWLIGTSILLIGLLVLLPLTVLFADPQWSRYIYMLQSRFAHDRLEARRQQYTGTWTDWLGDERVETQLRNGVEYGTLIAWYANGAKRSEAQVVAGQFHGSFRSWYPSGQRQEEGIYAHGKREGTWRFWHRRGPLLAEGVYKNDRPLDGTFRGGLIGQDVFEYSDGKGDGTYTAYYFNVYAKRMECPTKNGLFHGKSIEWDRDGKVKAVKWYYHGKEVTEKAIPGTQHCN